MARARYIRPEFFTDERLAEVSRDARLFYAGLWTLFDRNGIVQGSDRKFQAHIFPYDSDVSVEKYVTELNKIGRLYRFEFAGNSYLYCPTFSKNQKFHPDETPKYSSEILAAAEKSRGNAIASNGQPPANHLPAAANHLLTTCQPPASRGNAIARKPLTLTLTLTNTSTAAGAAFDFESLYAIFPKRGRSGHNRKSAGIKKAKKLVRTAEDYARFERAVNNYAESRKGQDPQYTVAWGNWVSDWEEWAERPPPQSVAQPLSDPLSKYMPGGSASGA